MTTKLAAAALLGAVLLGAATRIDVKTQTKNTDWSGAASVRPFRVGTVLPLQCQTGEMFFKTDATPGANSYGCTTPGVWTAQGQGSTAGGGAASEAPLGVTRTSGSVLSLGENCSSMAACRVRIGSQVHSITAPATVTVQSGTGTVYLFIADDGAVVAGSEAASAPAILCTNCRAASPVIAFPADSIPLAFWNATSGVWDPSGADTRAVLSTPRSFAAGPNITITETASKVVISADSATGSGTELQHHKNGKLAAVESSSVDAGALRLGAAIPAGNALLTLGAPLAGGHASGTALGMNAPAGFTGDLVNGMIGDASVFRVTPSGEIILPGSASWSSAELRLAADSAETAFVGNASTTAGSSLRIFVAGADASNQVRVGTGSAASLVVNGVGKTAIGTAAPAPAGAADGPDLIVRDATPVSGDTQVIISAGAAQSRNLTEWVDAGGTAGARVSPEGALQNLPYGVQPACTAATRGMLWHFQAGTGVKDDVQVCAKDSADVFAWRVLF
jgi:hypothetical protein